MSGDPVSCPKCGTPAPMGAAECSGCGVIFARARDTTAPRPSDREPTAAAGISRDGWRALAIGAPLALMLPLLPPVNFLLTPLITIVHELGHTAAYWLFGYPAYPAFDFLHGGGVTVGRTDRQPLVVLVWLAAAGWGAYQLRRRPGLAAGVLLSGLVYLAALSSVRIERTAIGVAGHGFELLFAAVFLYRGATGWGCRRPSERPLYAFVGSWIVFYDVGFAWGLATDAYARTLYEQGKRGLDPDLVIVGRYVRTTLGAVARFTLVAALSVAPLALLAARERARISSALLRLRQGGD